jgi:MFS family permease
MTPYTIALFVHVLGVIVAFIGVGVWLVVAVAVRWARQVAEVRALSRLAVATGNVAVAGVLLIAAAGLYMAWTTWGWQTAWIDVATVSFLLLAPFGALVLDPRIRALAEASTAAPDGPLPPVLAAQTHDPLLVFGLNTYVGVLFGIVFLMTIKPALGVALITMGVALALGALSAVPFARVKPVVQA